MNENTLLSKSLEEKTSSYNSLNLQLLETKNRLTAVEQSLKEKEERLASNDKGNFIKNYKLNNTFYLTSINFTMLTCL